MKVWTKIKLKDRDKNIEIFSNAITNYLYKYGPITEICKKYGITYLERKRIEQHTANRIAGILTLYLAKDNRRIHDIINKYYNSNDAFKEEIIPELEGYIERTRSKEHNEKD